VLSGSRKKFSVTKPFFSRVADGGGKVGAKSEARAETDTGTNDDGFAVRTGRPLNKTYGVAKKLSLYEQGRQTSVDIFCLSTRMFGVTVLFLFCFFWVSRRVQKIAKCVWRDICTWPKKKFDLSDRLTNEL
jgi:hypothetical protein